MTLPAPPPAGSRADVDVTHVDRIAAAVLGCPSVAALHGGLFGEIATYLPGRRISGIRYDPGNGRVEVHVVGHFPDPVDEIAAQVRAAVTAAVASTIRPVVDVTIEDYLDPAVVVVAAAVLPDPTVAAPVIAAPAVLDPLTAQVAVTTSGTAQAVPPVPVVDHVDVVVIPSSQE